MKKLFAVIFAGLFALAVTAPVIAADKKDEGKEMTKKDGKKKEAKKKDSAKKEPKKTDESSQKKGGFGISTLMKPSGSENKSAEVVGSGASRGLDRELNAKGGPVTTMVAVSLTAAEIAAFKKEGDLR